jgi:outer membrane protein OmpA-like peptidoglycan-associated protein
MSALLAVLLAAPLAHATHVSTYALDPLYTKGPFAGMGSLVVDPAAVLPKLQPYTSPTPKGALELTTEAVAPDRALVFTNPTDTWAVLHINGMAIGNIGPYATARFEGLKPGPYWLTLVLPSGFHREFLVRTAPKPRARTAIPVKVDLMEDRIVLSDKIYFELDSAVIEADSFGLLDALAKTLADHPEIQKVRVEGHTDQQGAAEYNQKLSDSRSQAVRDYLVKAGVAGDRLDAMGFGETQLVDRGENEDAYEKNRRVELKITARTPVVAPEPVKPVKKGK